MIGMHRIFILPHRAKRPGSRCPGFMRAIPGGLGLAGCLIWFFCAHFATAELPPGRESLTADQILDRLREQLSEQASEASPFTFLRESVIYKLDSGGQTNKVERKTYRAFTHGEDQALVSINGRLATAQEREQDRLHNLERQQRYLHRKVDREEEAQERLMARNMDLFRRKFHAEKTGMIHQRGRDAFTLKMTPKEEVELEHGSVNRLMNAMEGTLWVDAQTFHPVGVAVRMLEPVTFAGGLLGVIRHVELHVWQKQLAPGVWVDEQIEASFDMRLLFKNIRFHLTSISKDFEPHLSHTDRGGSVGVETRRGKD